MPSTTPLPRPFVHLAWSNLAAQSAEQLGLAAAPIVAVMALQAGPGEIGALATVQTLPFLLLSIPLGLLADRASRRRLMIAAETLRALSLFGLLALVLSGHVSIVGLALLGFVGAVGTVGFSVAAPSLVPSLVPRETLAAANGRLELARSAAYAAGPALAGALVAWSGAPAAFTLAAMLSVAAVLLLARIAEPQRAPLPARHPLRDLQDGARLVWGHDLLRPILLTAVAWNIAWFVLQAAYVPYAVRVLGMNPGGVGITLGCYGAGMVAGALLASRIVGALPFGRAVQLGPACSVLASALMASTLAWPTPLLAAASFFVFGAGPVIWVITSTTLRQTVTPHAMLGRVSAIFLAVNAGARPIGAALGGLIGAAFGEGACLWLSLAGFVLQAVLISVPAVRTLRGLPAPA